MAGFQKKFSILSLLPKFKGLFTVFRKRFEFLVWKWMPKNDETDPQTNKTDQQKENLKFFENLNSS